MRIILSIPALAIVILAYNLIVPNLPTISGGFFELDSSYFDAVLPSGAEIFFQIGHIFVAFGLVALFFEIIKAARTGAGTVLDHMLSTVVFVVALVEFLLVPFCGTVTFFFLMAMALIDVVAGFTVSILSARRDLSVGRDGS